MLVRLQPCRVVFQTRAGKRKPGAYRRKKLKAVAKKEYGADLEASNGHNPEEKT